MFKRFACLILSLVLLMGLIPAAAITASAASNGTSDKAITILKKLETFVDHCDANGYTGYGTKCDESGRHGVVSAHSTGCNSAGYLPNGTPCSVTSSPNSPHGPVHTIRENEASAELEKAIENIDSAINTFATNRGVALSQQQHDALAIFSFENGTGWTQGTDGLQDAVTKDVSNSDFVQAMVRWKYSDNDTRRKIEANMYLYGVYSSTINVAAFDASTLKITEEDTYDSEDLVNDDRVKVTVTNAYINVREKANIFATQVGTVYAGDVLRITDTENANGYLWGRYVDENYDLVGYVALMYTNYDQVIAGDKLQQEQNGGDPNAAMGTAVVNVNGYVNVRSGPGTKNPIVSSLRNNTTVDLYEIQYVNGQRWARTNLGWFSLAYARDVKITDGGKVQYNDLNYLSYQFKRASDGKAFTANSSVVEIKPATFTTITEVTVRAENIGDQLNGARVDTLAKGTEFDVTYVFTDKNTIWGWTKISNTTEGWVDLGLQYVTRNGVALKDESESDVKCTLGTAKLDVNVRAKADIFGKKVGTLPAGTVVEVLEGPVNGTRMTGWYRLNFTNASGTESWVRGDNLDIREGTKGEITYGKTPTSPNGSQAATGQGMVANTYGGVNVRTAPGTANAKVTKLLPGTVVDIQEVTYYGSTKWGRIEQGWVCMDYIAMMDYDDLGTSGGASGSVSGGAVVTTSAIFEAKAREDGVKIYEKPDSNSDVIRNLGGGDTLTIHELLTSTEVTSESEDKKTTLTRYWARVNDGYICDNLDFERNSLNAVLAVDPLYEETFTVTETDMLKVREGAGTSYGREDLDLKKGEQVVVTNVVFVGSQYWGLIEHDKLTNGEGWICLNYTTRGAVAVGGGEGSGEAGGDAGNTGNGGATTAPSTMSIGNTGVATYAGKVTGSAQVQEVNVRKEPSSNSEKVTDLKKGTAITITETRLVDGRSWGYCGSGWINLLYVDLTPVGTNAIDAKVIAVDNTLVYESSETGAKVVGSYTNRAVVNIYEEMNGMYKTDMGWISKGNCL